MTLEIEIYAAIIAVYVMIVISPGPNFILVTRYSLGSSLALAFTVTLGLAIGATINASITMFGVGAIIIAYPAFGVLISLLGGGYLCYLGLPAIFAAVRTNRLVLASGLDTTSGDSYSGTGGQITESYSTAFRKGMLVNLLNPKGIVFFMGLYAPLIAKASPLTKGAVLASSFLIELIWYGLVILFLSRQKFRTLYDRARFAIDVVLALVLTLIGLHIMMQATTFLEAT
ncbi:MAG: LysE family translocator [Colwellia sp.]|nr:LysE family translocator [Colwellia sp.]